MIHIFEHDKQIYQFKILGDFNNGGHSLYRFGEGGPHVLGCSVSYFPSYTLIWWSNFQAKMNWDYWQLIHHYEMSKMMCAMYRMKIDWKLDRA